MLSSYLHSRRNLHWNVIFPIICSLHPWNSTTCKLKFFDKTSKIGNDWLLYLTWSIYKLKSIGVLLENSLKIPTLGQDLKYD